MDQIAKAAVIIAQAMCALTECVAMFAENYNRAAQGRGLYADDAFTAVLDRYGIEAQAVLRYLQD